MMRAAKRRYFALGIALASLTILTSCSADNSGQASDVVSRQEAQRYQTQTSEQDAINRRNADLPSRPTGVVDIDGSTSGSLTSSEARLYSDSGSATVVNVGNNSEDAAFQELCAGEIDLVDSARPITKAEWDACQSVGLDVVQFQVAAEAVVLAIKSETDVGGDCLTTEQVRDIFRAGSPVTSWAQLGLDDVPLRVGGPDPTNDGFSFFGRTVLGSPNPALTNFRSDYSVYDTDQGSRRFVVGDTKHERLALTYADRARRRDLLKSQLVTAWQVRDDAHAEVVVAQAEQLKGIRDHRTPADRASDDARVAAAFVHQTLARQQVNIIRAKYHRAVARLLVASNAKRFVAQIHGRVAYFRFSYYELFEDQLRPFEITLPTGERNCIFPSQWTITNGEYPLSRQLLMTTTTRSLARPEVSNFLKDYLSNAQDLSSAARLVSLPDSSIKLQQAWLNGDQAPPLLNPNSQESTQTQPTPSQKPVR